MSYQSPPDRSAERKAFLDKNGITLPGFLEQDIDHPRKSGSISVKAGLEPYTGEWDSDTIRHLMRRTLFGVKRDHYNALSALSREEAVMSLLETGARPDPPINDYNSAADGIEDPVIPFGETFVNAEYAADVEGDRILSTKAWWIRNIINQDASIEEKMIFFWHNHIPIAQYDVFWSAVVYRNIDTIRTHALGNFKTLVREMTIDPAMLLFLNGSLNSKEAPDENFARELQELFCIGKGPDANYTEQDVQNAAKVLTGWKVEWPHARSIFYDWDHDTSDKQFSSFYGNRVIRGRTGAEGADEMDELLDMIFENNETALFLARKLYRFFVYYDITDETERTMIQPMAQMLRDNNYEITPVLSALFNSAHFYDIQLRGAAIKSPLDFTLGMFRTFDMPIQMDDIRTRYLETSPMVWIMSGAGLLIGDPPSVSGYPAWYQEPSYDKYWITTHTIKERGLRTDSMVYWGLWNLAEPISIDVLAFTENQENPLDAQELVVGICKQVYGIIPGQEQIDVFISRLTDNKDTAYWTAAWNLYLNNRDNDGVISVVRFRLQQMLQAVLQLPESHLY